MYVVSTHLSRYNYMYIQHEHTKRHTTQSERIHEYKIRENKREKEGGRE